MVKAAQAVATPPMDARRQMPAPRCAMRPAFAVLMKTLPLHLAASVLPATWACPLITFTTVAACAEVAATDAKSNWQGDWEVTRVLMTGGTQPQWSMRQDDPRLMARTLHLEAGSVRFRNTDFSCAVLQANDKPQAMRSLFAQSAASSQRPPAIHGTLYGLALDYELGSLNGRAVQLLELRCKPDTADLMAQANWLALTVAPSASSAALLMPYQPDALLVLRRTRVGADPDAAKTSYCQQATSASDKAICADRQLWRMQSYTQSALKRAQSPQPEVNAALEKEVLAQLQKRQACQGDRHCLYEVLDRHIELLVQRW